MKDIHQIKLLEKALKKEKEKYMIELAKLDIAIQKKKMLIEKMTLYLKEYHAENKFKITKQHPALFVNLENFSMDIEDVISKTIKEVDELNNTKKTIFDKMQKIEQKIKLMNVFEDKIKIEKAVHENRKEQATLDDYSAVKMTRGNHD